MIHTFQDCYYSFCPGDGIDLGYIHQLTQREVLEEIGQETGNKKL